MLYINTGTPAGKIVLQPYHNRQTLNLVSRTVREENYSLNQAGRFTFQMALVHLLSLLMAGTCVAQLDMALVYLLTLFLAATCAAPGGNTREVKWTRTVLDLNALPVKVQENVLVTETDSETTVLMNSSDTSLLHTPFLRAVTLHDFRANLLALKPYGTNQCFVGQVLKSYDEVVTEIKVRAKTGYSPPTPDRRRVAMSSRETLDRTGSEVLDKFCSGRRLIPIKDLDFSGGPCGGWEPVCPPLLCFWVPVDVFMEKLEAQQIREVL